MQLGIVLFHVLFLHHFLQSKYVMVVKGLDTAACKAFKVPGYHAKTRDVSKINKAKYWRQPNARFTWKSPFPIYGQKHDMVLVVTSESLFSLNIKGKYLLKKYLFSYHANQLYPFCYFSLSSITKWWTTSLICFYTLSVEERKRSR